MTTNDDILIEAIGNGDTKAYAQLVDRYKDLVYTLAIRMLKHKEEAEEVAQDVFIDAFQNIDKFNQQSSLKTWIYRIAVNKSMEKIRYRNIGWLHSCPDVVHN